MSPERPVRKLPEPNPSCDMTFTWWSVSKALRTAPMPSLRRVRLQAARHRLLRSDHTLGEIASECGVYDQSHTSRLFKHSFGWTPLAFRKRHLASGRQAV